MTNIFDSHIIDDIYLKVLKKMKEIFAEKDMIKIIEKRNGEKFDKNIIEIF